MLKTSSILLLVGFLSIGLACGGRASSSAKGETPDVHTEEAVRASATTSTSGAPALANDIEIGSKVGNRILEFSMRLADGSTVSSTSLANAKEPAFLYFFATWCATCRAELTRMRDVYPDYAERVSFFLVAVDPTESLDQLEETRRERNYTWPVAKPLGGMLRELRVIQESAKIGIDADGIITYRRGGGGDSGLWAEVFSKLADSADS